MSEFITNIFVDSRFRQSGTGSDFTLELPENLSTAGDACMRVAAVSFPLTFWTVEAGMRDRIALQLYVPSLSVALSTFVEIQQGQYDGFTFAEALQTSLNRIRVPGKTLPTWEVLYVPSENRLVIQSGELAAPARSWQFVSEKQLQLGQAQWTGPSYDPQNLHMLDKVTRLEAEPYPSANEETYVTGYFDSYAGISEVYLQSIALSCYKSPGPMLTTRSTIARIPVEAEHGATAHWVSMGHTFDFLPVPYLSARQLDFRLCDAKGQAINLHGGAISSHLRFHDYPNGA